MKIYENFNDNFKILDYLVSHNSLLLRSFPQANKGREYNIDLTFKNVHFISIPSMLFGIEISLVDSFSISKDIFKLMQLKENISQQIFSIRDREGKEYFIDSGAVGVSHNQLGLLESSLKPISTPIVEEDILWFTK